MSLRPAFLDGSLATIAPPSPLNLRRPRKCPGGALLCLLTILMALMLIPGALSEGEVRLMNVCGIDNITPAVDPSKDHDGYSAVLYDVDNGLPVSDVNAIAQTGDGFIWIGSYGGLIRFDGNEFETINSEEGVLIVRCLYVDSQDRLWIGTNDSGLYLMSKGMPQRVDRRERMISSSVRSIVEDGEGLIYVGCAAGMYTVDQSLNLMQVGEGLTAGELIYQLHRGADGLIYGVTMDGDLFTFQGGQLHSYLRHEDCGIERIDAVLPDPYAPGAVYLAADNENTRCARIYRVDSPEGFVSARVWTLNPLSGVGDMEFIDGRLWVCADNGVGVLDDDGFHLLENLPIDRYILQMMTDYEGNLWFASSHQGLLKIVPNRFQDLFEHYGLSDVSVNATCFDDEGRLFVGTDEGLIVIDGDKPLQRLPLTRAVTAGGSRLNANDLLRYLSGVRIRSIIRDSRDRLWLSTWSQCGLLRYDHGALTAFTQSDGMIAEPARVVYECSDGRFLVAQPNGVSVIEGDRVVARYGAQDGLRVTSVLTVLEGEDGDIILGTDGGGITIFSQDGSMRHLGLEDGLHSEIIMRVKKSRDGTFYWIVAGNSLAVMSLDYEITTLKGFPFPDNFDIYENSRGDVWVISGNGIYVADLEEMLADGDIDAVYYGISSGLPYIANANSYSAQTAEEDLYISGSKGVIRVNLESEFSRIDALKVALPYVDVNGQRIYPDDQGSFTLPRNTRRLRIHPYVLAFSPVDPEVSYELKGFDEAETTVRRSTLGPVDYTNLPGGQYSFELHIRDALTDEIRTVSFAITKEPRLTPGSVGSILINLAAILFMIGILIYTALFRQLGRLDDQLFFASIVTNMILAASEVIAYALEGTTISGAREIVIACNVVFLITFELFPCLYTLYIEYRSHRDASKARRVGAWLAAPGVVAVLILLLTIGSEWIFWVDSENLYHAGPLNGLMLIPAGICLLWGLYRAWFMDRRMAFSGILILTARVICGVWFREVSSTAFTFTLFLVYAHIHVMNEPLPEVSL